MTTRSRLILAIHRALLQTARTPLLRVWALVYRLAAKAWARYLTRGEPDAAAYVRGSLGGADALPGLSDVDVAVILSEDPAGPGLARERASERWMRLRRAFRLTDLLLDYPMIFEEPELRDVADTSTYTYDGAAYYGDRVSQDKIRLLERPGLYGSTADWRPLPGRDRRPPAAIRDPQQRRLAAWLELASWWQWTFPACVDPSGPRTASLCVKLVTEPARIWLWLAHGQRAGGRAEVLERALRRLPEEEQAFRRVLELNRSLATSPDPPLEEVVPLLVRLSARIAELMAREVEAEGTTEVRLAGADDARLLLPYREPAPSLLPLCDWNALVHPNLLDECIAPLPGDPSAPADLAAAMLSQRYGPLPALRTGPLMVLPAPRSRTGMRAAKCPLSDPVSFALLEGGHSAAFPNVRGWSVEDTASRAAAEHRAWLAGPPRPVAGIGGSETAGGILAMLLGAARAGLFLETVQEGEPELPLTATETARSLAARSTAARGVAEDALDRYRAFTTGREAPPEATLAALRGLVEELPAYARQPAERAAAH